MGSGGDGQSGGLSKLVMSVVMVIAAFVILRFVVGVALGLFKWVFIGAAVVAIAWYFTSDSGSGSGSG